MARYKIEMPVGATRYKVELPIGATTYKVQVPGGTGSIVIDMAGAPPGASWTLRDSIPVIVATGTAGETNPYPYDVTGYTLTWEDTAFPWVPPPPEGPTPLTAITSPITFGPP